MKIIIYQNREVYKEESKIGNDSENKVETLEFEFPEEYKDFTKYIEFQTKDEKYVDLIEDDKYIITRAIAKYGKIKAQIVLRNSLENDVAVFKSDIFELKVSKSINATIDVPIEYPTWIDNLTRLKQDIEHAEHERVSNENERISAEKTRQENFTEMQKTVENATSNIKDLKEEYNENAKQKTEEFNKNFEEKQKAINDNAEAKTTAFGENAEAQTKTFNTNSDDKLAEYNKNHTAKMKEFDDNYDTKTKTFDDNAAAKLDEYNKNTKLKEKSFNDNAGTKTETFNSNAADKQNEFDENASDKLSEYNQNAKELINKVEQVQAENEALKVENKLIKEQIPGSSVRGNSIHVEDSGSLELEWKLRCEHYQKQTIQNDNLLILEDTTITTNGITLTIKDGVITINGTSTASTNIDFKIKKKLKAGTYWHMVQRSGSAPSGNVGFLVMKSGGSIASINGRGGAAFTLNEDTEVFYRIWTDKNNTISNVAYKCSISEGSDSKLWVQGIPDSPSIDYSSEIETVGSNVNLCDNSKILVGVDPKDSSEKDFRTSDYIKVEYGKSYIASLYNEKKVRIGNLVYQEWNKNLEKLQQITTDTIKITNQDIAYVTVRNYKNDAEEIKNEFYYKFEESLIATPYSPYNQGGVEIDVVNSNLLDFNVTQDSRVTVNKDGTLTINGTGGFVLNIDKLQLKAGITYYQKVELISGSISGSNINNTFLSFAGTGAWISSEKFSQTNSTKDTEKTTILINASAIFNNAVIKIWANTDKSDFVLHQSQTAIMSIQQAMLEGDYVADVEHHEWGKVVLTGEEVLIDSSSTSTRKWWGIDFSNYGIYQYNDPTKVCDVLTTKFKSRPQQGTFLPGQVALITNNKNMYFVFEPDTTEEQARAILKDMPVYFRLATPINLELTEEQKAVREQKMYTYKNITNISLSDELASIDVEYKKDLETEHNKLQNEIDEIKQLISTTETSALLLDNLQKDVEKEVE